MPSERRQTVLIVEDDPGTARLVRTRLERAGYAVESAATAEAGMTRIRGGGVDLVVLDQRLPDGLSGLELYERIKAAGFDVPAILATGFGDEATLVGAIRAGVRDFVPKTADYLNFLPPAVTRVLQQVAVERELVESRARAREALVRQKELEAEIAERERAQHERDRLFQELQNEVEQRKRAEEALREADRRKDEFLAMLAHELRNPLAPIRNALEVMKQSDAAPEALRQTREMMERQVQVMARLVEDLLDVSRITRGKVELRKGLVDLRAVVDRAVETARPLIEARGHEFTMDLPPESLPVEGDAVRLAQVIANLLNNAAKYTEPGGRIRLSAGREGGEIVLRVRDTGVGIAPDVLPHVFDLFVQEAHPSNLSQGGLGIGLTLVKRLVEMHGGRVEAHSEGAGKGSEFVVRLPAAEATPPGPEPGPTTGGSAAGRRILVVDDNADSADSLAELLQFWGHEVRTAHSGAEALDAARDFRPDAVLLDLGMPDMNGYEAARLLRDRAGLNGTAFIALTGYGQDAERRRSAEAGFQAHLVKPVDPEELRKLLAGLKDG